MEVSVKNITLDIINEQVWRNFTFHLATEKDVPKICKHLYEHFGASEPLNVHLGNGVYNQDRQREFAEKVKWIVPMNLSFYLTEKDSDEIVAVHLQSDSRQASNFVYSQPLSENAKKIRGLLQKLAEIVKPKLESNYLNKYNYYGDIWISSVHTKYRKQGIGTEMFKRSCAILKAYGFPFVVCECSSQGTREICKKLGFEEIGRIYLKDYIQDNVEKLFCNAEDDEYVNSNVKLL